MTNDNRQPYHYTECGLDNVLLVNGFKIDENGMIHISNVKGLHDVIGQCLIFHKENLNGKEIRYLRTEMSLSQAALANLLQVSEQTVQRWETEKSEINKAAEALLRMLYAEHLDLRNDSTIKSALKKIALIEEEIDSEDRKVRYNKSKNQWEFSERKAA